MTFVYISFIVLQTVVLGAFLGQPKMKENSSLFSSSPNTLADDVTARSAPLAEIEDLGSSRYSTARNPSPRITNDLKSFLDNGVAPNLHIAPRSGGKNGLFLVFLCSTFLWCVGEWVDCIFPLWLSSENFSSLQIATLVTITTSCGVFGRLLASLVIFVTHKHNVMLCYNLNNFVMAIMSLILSFAEQFWSLIFVKGIQGLLFGAAVGFHAPIILEIVGLGTPFNYYAIKGWA